MTAGLLLQQCIRGVEDFGTEAGEVGPGGVHTLVAHQLRNDRKVHPFPLQCGCEGVPCHVGGQGDDGAHHLGDLLQVLVVLA